MISRHGKIARLPFGIREQLNVRLYDGATAASLVPWLNSLPAVQPLLDAKDWTNVGVTNDLAGIPRVLSSERTQ